MRAKKFSVTSASIICACLLLMLCGPGCAKEADCYQSVQSVYDAGLRMNELMLRSTEFMQSLKSIQLKDNPYIFSGLPSAVEDGREAIDDARTELDAMSNMDLPVQLDELGAAIEDYAREKERCLDELGEVLDYLMSLESALKPLIDAKVEISKMETVEVIDDSTVAIQRIDMILATREGTMEGMRKVVVPRITRELHDAMVQALDDLYRELGNWKRAGEGSVESGYSEEDYGLGLDMYGKALENLENGLLVNRSDEREQRLEDLIFEYLMKYRPEDE